MREGLQGGERAKMGEAGRGARPEWKRMTLEG